MTKECNIKYSKRYILNDYSEIHFCPQCEYHLTDMVDGSYAIYCPRCGQRVQIHRTALCVKDCEFVRNDIKTGNYYCTCNQEERILDLDIEGSPRMIKNCARDI